GLPLEQRREPRLELRSRLVVAGALGLLDGGPDGGNRIVGHRGADGETALLRPDELLEALEVGLDLGVLVLAPATHGEDETDDQREHDPEDRQQDLRLGGERLGLYGLGGAARWERDPS